MTFTAPVAQQLFALRHFARIDDLCGDGGFAELSSELVEAVVGEVGRLAEGEWAPLNHIGDENPARLENGNVVMPPGFDKAWAAYVDGGWAGLTAPTEYGGQGLPFALGMVTLESLGAANMAFGLCPMLSLGAIEALVAHGSQAQKSIYLPRLASGEWTGTMNLTEANAGSDVGALRTTATPVGDGTFRISGQKIFITFGEHELADNIVHLVLARTPDAPVGTKGISLFLVPKYRVGADGSLGEKNNIAALKVEHKMGIHASPTCVLQYGEGGECLGELIGEEYGGMRAMFTMMNNARINVGNQGVQIAERALQQALDYAAERIQSPRAGSASRDPVAIVEHPDVRRMLMRMKSIVDAIRALNFLAAGEVDRAGLGDAEAQTRADLLVPLVKSYSTDMGVEATSLNLQIHGGMGYMEETGAAQHYRDARIPPIYEGSNGIQAIDLVGRKLGLEGGDAMRRMIGDIRNDAAGETGLTALADAAGDMVAWMLDGASLDDKLAAATPFQTMLATLVCGGLMLQQEGVAKTALERGEGDPAFMRARAAAARFYLDHQVTEALGLQAGAMKGAGTLYALSGEELRA